VVQKIAELLMGHYLHNPQTKTFDFQIDEKLKIKIKGKVLISCQRQVTT
jgi:hypothetical protein